MFDVNHDGYDDLICHTSTGIIQISESHIVKQRTGETSIAEDGMNQAEVGSSGTTCSTISAPVNGQVSAGGSAAGSTVTFMCNTGYLLIGYPTITCSSTGVWSQKVPTCVKCEFRFFLAKCRQFSFKSSRSKIHSN